MDAMERFMNKVEPVPMSGCWLWMGYTDKKMGYGMFWLDGTMHLSHRIAYALFKGPIVDDLHVLHRCDVPCCVNPAHLWLGTNAQNVKDKVAKGRGASMKGERHPGAKLDEVTVRFIRESLESSRSLAKKIGIDRTTVGYIRKGKLWSHVQ